MQKIFALVLSLTLLSINAIGCSNKKQVKVIKIATQSSLSGSKATVGEAVKNGAQLAIDDNKDKFKDLGFDLQLASYDDQNDFNKRDANAQQIGEDQSILAVVGYAAPVQEYNLAMVYIYDGYVNRFDSSNKSSVHSILARPEVQYFADANFATNKLNANTIFIIDDDRYYSVSNNSKFQEQAQKNGATIAASIKSIPSDGKDLLNEVIEAKPDFIFFGGIYSDFGIFVKQARDKGIMVPMMGGDGVDSPEMYKIAGGAVKDVYYSTTTADVGKTSVGKKWAERYKDNFGKDPQTYSYYGYDAMTVVLRGLENAIQKNGGEKPSREQVLEAVHAIDNYQGIATEVSFNDRGENKFAKVFIRKFENNLYPGPLVSEKGQ